LDVFTTVLISRPIIIENKIQI